MELMKRLTPALAAVLGAMLFASSATAQQDQGQAQSTRFELYYPTGEEATSLMMIRAEAPQEVRVGQSYEYVLTVENITDNVALEDVRIQHQSSGNFSVESARVVSREEGQGQKQGQGQKKQGQSQKKQGRSGSTVRIGELLPGKAQTVRVEAVAEQEGIAGVCFRVAYTPTVCLTTRFVKPELEVTKATPERADICQPLRFRYTVTNPGSAAVEGVVVTDELPDGLETEDGESTLSHEVGTIEAGESREFTALILANQAGTFASRARAESETGPSAQSKKVGPRIVQASLNAEIQGPDVQYIDQPGTYRVTVRNDGDGPAIDTRLEVAVDERVSLIRTSKTSRNGVAPEQPGDGTLSWDIGTLDPGQSTDVSFTVNLTSAPEGAASEDRTVVLKHVAEATSRCAQDDDEQVREAATAQATAEAEVLTLPALLLALVDRNDQVPRGEHIEYVVTVINQGAGQDNNVRVRMNLPDGVEFVRADGPTNAQADGQTVTFEPVQTVEPGQELQWEVIAKANTSGQVSTRAELNSEFLSTRAVSVEPTTLLGENIKASSGNQSGGGNQNNQKNNN